jgi:hypothetical protein
MNDFAGNKSCLHFRSSEEFLLEKSDDYGIIPAKLTAFPDFRSEFFKNSCPRKEDDSRIFPAFFKN